MSATFIIVKQDEAVRQRAVDHILGLSRDKPWNIEIKKHVKKRSLSQNALMWKWINQAADIIGRHTGYDADDMHEFFKAKFLPAAGRTRIVIDGIPVERFTTTKLNTKEMHDYMGAIDRWAVSYLGLRLPHPEDAQRR